MCCYKSGLDFGCTHIFEAGLLEHVTVPLDRLQFVTSLSNIVLELLAMNLTIYGFIFGMLLIDNLVSMAIIADH